MSRFDAGLSGLTFFTMGLFVLVRWRIFIQDIIDSDHVRREKWGMTSRVSEKGYWLIGGSLTKLVGAGLVLGGILLLYFAVTGRDWPFHYAN